MKDIKTYKPKNTSLSCGQVLLRDYAYEEAKLIGCNMAFAPVVDIPYNWQNTEIISRAFGNDPKRVAEMGVQYLEGAHELGGFACAAKHYPGNGLDFRDAHLSNNINDMSSNKCPTADTEIQ